MTTFFNKELEAAYQALGRFVGNRLDTLDSISSDIKTLEAEFDKSGIREEISVFVCGHYDGCTDEIHYSIEERLSWRPWPEGGKKWRIVYERHRGPSRMELGFADPYPSIRINCTDEVQERRPFIETPAATRLRVHSGLVKLATAASEMHQRANFK